MAIKHSNNFSYYTICMNSINWKLTKVIFIWSLGLKIYLINSFLSSETSVNYNSIKHLWNWLTSNKIDTSKKFKYYLQIY